MRIYFLNIFSAKHFLVKYAPDWFCALRELSAAVPKIILHQKCRMLYNACVSSGGGVLQMFDRRLKSYKYLEFSVRLCSLVFF